MHAKYPEIVRQGSVSINHMVQSGALDGMMLAYHRQKKHIFVYNTIFCIIDVDHEDGICKVGAVHVHVRMPMRH
jgi:hypothetical protein